MEKEKERSEVKVQEGPEGFGFLKGEKYIFKYSVRPKEGMKVTKRSDPPMSLTRQEAIPIHVIISG